MTVVLEGSRKINPSGNLRSEMWPLSDAPPSLDQRDRSRAHRPIAPFAPGSRRTSRVLRALFGYATGETEEQNLQADSAAEEDDREA